MLKGMGLQALASIGTLSTSLFVSIPFGALFAFYLGLSIAGLWLGLCLGLFTLGVYNTYLLISADWNKIAM
jgi:MATE family multidrug resistance protein